MAPIPIWSIIKNVIRAPDIQRVCLPVILNEPMSGCQRNGEILVSSKDIFDKAAECEDSIRRMALLSMTVICPFNTCKFRTKKPFNPMLYETHEFVTNQFRMLSEKVEHDPRQITMTYFEGKGYKFSGYYWAKPSFKFYGGRGAFEVVNCGVTDVYLKKFNQNYSMSRPIIVMKNIIFGPLEIDVTGKAKVLNHETKEYADITFNPALGNKTSNVEVDIFDS
jgi:hypothetical protein